MSEIVPILVNGKKYQVQTLPVLDTIDFHIEALDAFGDLMTNVLFVLGDIKEGKQIEKSSVQDLFRKISPEKIKPLKKKILAQVINPENNFLGDEVTIEEWFSRKENREDIWEVLIKGCEKLLGEYLPNFLRDLSKKGLEKVTAEQSQSQKNTEQAPSSISQ